ncbi:MFS general substrate transporter [Penicillium argentinense]|uniref:MFS general substrate transporter n=1 Tax=Penicillium argentinense TaxID=1131581 RepID=A0A9W9EPJ5_9EURO|nr:MFS general substrate transporter [Penicillium argentinense]KAJ5085564.1 MFS general substrate transporter [Penicillium argentinense]
MEQSGEKSKIAPEVMNDHPADSDSNADPKSLALGPGVGSRLRLRVTLLALALLMMAVILNVSSISSALPTISRDLGINAIEAFWVGTSSLICSANEAAFQPVYGSLSSILGRKPVMMMAIAFFTAGTIISSQASNAIILLLGRSIQGLGAGGIHSLSEVILTDVVPLRLRGRYLAYLNSTWAFGSITGPVIGAAFAQKVTWRWLFYINIPLVVSGFILMMMFTKLQPLPDSMRKKLHNIDGGGIILFTGGITAVLIPVTWGGVMYDWDSWQTLTPFLIGGACLVFFVAYEAYIAANPMIPLALFRTRTLVVSYVGTTTMGLILSCGLYYLPFYFQAVKGYSPILSGVALFPVTFTLVPGAMATGVLISRTGLYRGMVWAGWLISTIGLGFNCFVRVDSPDVLWIMCLVVRGLGMGMLLSSLNLTVLAAAAPQREEAAGAATMYTFFSALGQTLGVALGGTIFANRIRASLQAQPSLEALLSNVTSGHHADSVALIQMVGDISDPATRHQVQKVYVDSLRVVWAFCCALSGVAGLLSLATRHYDMSQQVVTQQALRGRTMTRSRSRSRTIESGDIMVDLHRRDLSKASGSFRSAGDPDGPVHVW